MGESRYASATKVPMAQSIAEMMDVIDRQQELAA